MAKAIKGDYKIPIGLRQLSIDEMKEYIFIDYLDDYRIYKKLKSSAENIQYDYIIGYHDTNGFNKVAKIYFNHVHDYYEVDTIYVSEDIRGSGLATKLYTYFATVHKYSILGSDMQRFGARRLWAKLSEIEDLNVSIIDFDTAEIIDSNVTVYHGIEDSDFDRRVWSSDNDKRHIRLLLKCIK